jgi:2-polyprenyl-6-methoxyphenol hydroxylase-like FAD-dependent oxidoreductase
MDKIDVLIVGAGPTGLTLAIECKRYNLTFRIIDSANGPSTISGAAAIQARTLEVFQVMGIHDEFLEAGNIIKSGNIYSAHKRRAHLDFTLIPSPFSLILGLEQNKTEAILESHLEKLGGTVERSTTLLSYEERDGSIFCTTDKGVIKTQYLVGCDGAHSAVRKSMGCSFQGKQFSDIFSLADIEMDWDLPPHELHIFLEKKGTLAIFPLSEKNRFRAVFLLERLKGKLKDTSSAKHGIIRDKSIKDPTLEELQGLISLFIKEKAIAKNPRWMANFHINSRLSNNYHKNNVFLCGDAAHIHSPIGGQGMNTGIQDAFNLAWKLAYTCKGFTKNTDLLNSYQEERHSLGKKLLKATERASFMVTTNNSILKRIRKHIISFLLSFRSIRKKMVTAISQVNIGYPDKRAPNFELTDSDLFTKQERSQKFHLVLFNTKDIPFDHPQVKIHYAKEKSKTKALLVRPDGYIALVDYPPFKKLLSYKI